MGIPSGVEKKSTKHQPKSAPKSQSGEIYLPTSQIPNQKASLTKFRKKTPQKLRTEKCRNTQQHAHFDGISGRNWKKKPPKSVPLWKILVLIYLPTQGWCSVLFFSTPLGNSPNSQREFPEFQACFANLGIPGHYWGSIASNMRFFLCYKRLQILQRSKKRMSLAINPMEEIDSELNIQYPSTGCEYS